MHSQDCNSVITTQSQQASSHCNDCKSRRKKKQNLHPTKWQISTVGRKFRSNDTHSDNKRDKECGQACTCPLRQLASWTVAAMFALLQCYQCVWDVCLRSRACVNSTYPIVPIAGIPLAACVSKRGDEDGGMLPLCPLFLLWFLPGFFSFPHQRYFFFLCTAAVEVTV